MMIFCIGQLASKKSAMKLFNRTNRLTKTSLVGQSNAGLAFCRIAAFLAALALIVFANGRTPASAGSFSYSTSQRNIHCGILLIDSAAQVDTDGNYYQQNAADSYGNSNNIENYGPDAGHDIIAPYAFYILDRRLDVKPWGWVLSNPLAPLTVTQQMVDAFPELTLNQQVTENMLVYWHVSLPIVAKAYTSTGTNELSQFDLLVIHTHRLIGLSQIERECLRNYVDAGGTLWIEDSGGAYTTVSDGGAANDPAGIIADVFFNDTGSNPRGFAYVPGIAQHHPIITTPYLLSSLELNNMGDKDVNQYFMSSMNTPSTPFAQPDPSLLATVIGNAANADPSGNPLPYIAAGDYGSGHVVIDNADSMDAISNPVNANNGTGFCGSNLQAAGTQDLKFATNVIAWSSNTAPTQNVNDRHTAFQNVPIYGSMLKNWRFPDTSLYNNTGNKPPTFSVSGIAIEGNVAYVSTNDTYPSGAGSVEGRLRAFDLIPSEDLDGDGLADDGWHVTGSSTSITDPVTIPSGSTTGLNMLQDYSQSHGYDELWFGEPGDDGTGANSNVDEISSPTVAYLPGKSSANVIVENSAGIISIYDAGALPQTSAAKNLSLAPIATLPKSLKPNGTFGTGNVPPAPTYYRGWLICEWPGQTVYLYDWNTNQEYTVKVNDNLNTDTSSWVGSPVAAAIPSLDSTYGGTDVIAYVTTQVATYAIFLGARDEHLSGTGTPFTTVASAINGSLSFSQVIGAPEDAYTGGGMGSYFTYINQSPTWDTDPSPTAPPVFPSFRLSSTTTGSKSINVFFEGSDNGSTAYGDYDIVPTNNGTLVRQFYLGALSSAESSSNAVIQGAAVGPDNLLYFTVNETDANGINTGYIEAVQDQNVLNSGGTPGTIVKWRFALVTMPASLSGDNIEYNFAGYQFVGGPVLDGNHVYALISNGTNTAVLCFNPTPVCTTTLNAAINSIVTLNQVGQSVLLKQTDETVTANISSGQTANNETLTGNNVQYRITDLGSGNITFTDYANIPSPGFIGVQANLGAPMPVFAEFEQQNDNNPTGASQTQTTALLNTSGNGSPMLDWFTQVAFNYGAFGDTVQNWRLPLFRRNKRGGKRGRRLVGKCGYCAEQHQCRQQTGCRDITTRAVWPARPHRS